MTSAMGMTWYMPESYRQMRAVAEDEFVETFDEWVLITDKKVRAFEAKSGAVEKILIEIPECVRWCRANGYQIDQKGRAAFGAHLMVLREMPGKG